MNLAGGRWRWRWRWAACWWLGCLIGLAAEPSAAAGESPASFELAEIAPGVWVHTGQIGDFAADNGGDIANMGFVIGSRCVAVIDTGGSRRLGERLRTAILAQTRLPVCFVIATHMHPDHLLGHAAFADDHPAFVAAAKQIPALAARAAGYLQRQQSTLGPLADGSRIIPPDHPVANSEVLDLGGRTLALRTWRTAHTDNDLTVEDSSSGTLFTGDLVFRGHLPVIDGSLRGWLAALEQLQAIVRGPLVPGHGAVFLPQGKSEAAGSPIELERVYLEGLAREVRAALAAHKTLQQTVAQSQPPVGWMLTELYHRRNVTAAYAELEWED